VPDPILAGLDPEQQAVAETVRGPVCVLAGAGTGKTRAVTHRIAHAVRTGAVAPEHVLALTFTTRAAGEMRGRLRQLAGSAAQMDRVQARTFHAAALRQLVYFWPRTVGGEAPRVLDSKLALVAEAARAAGLKPGKPELRDMASEIEWAKAVQARPEEYATSAGKAGRAPPFTRDDAAAVYAGYEALRRERHLLDFESMLELTAAILAEHSAAADQVRSQYRYFVVDEYQDVNPLQKLVLDCWLGGRDDICVVGDPNQTIYSFTGATSAFLTSFSTEFRDATVIRLVRDYRSTPQVVGVANRLISARRSGAAGAGSAGGASAGGGGAGGGGAEGSGARNGGTGIGGADGGGSRWAGLTAQRDDGPEPELTGYPDEQAEAAAVASRARSLIGGGGEGVPARQIAVLVRTNAQTAAYEQAFTDAGVPYLVRGAERFFERPVVRQALVLFRAAAKSEPSGGNAAGEPVTEAVRHILSGLGLTEQPPSGGGAARERWESLAALAQLAEDVAVARPGAALADFAAELGERSSLQHAPAMDGVTLASLHSAKGLEWDAVFLPGLVEGVLPIVYAQSPDSIEEERRLLYVGVTRARERLYLSWSAARSPGGRPSRARSRFIDDLRPGPVSTGTDPAGNPASAAARRRGRAAQVPRCRVCGRPLSGAAERKLGRCGTCPADLDEAVLARLIQWRRSTAAGQKVPAYVVFTDTTLQAIAEVLPRTGAELAGVPGVGSAKLDKYGAEVLAICAGEVSRADGAEPAAGPAPPDCDEDARHR
jgi:DNA helicase II / ATP-dependent DNA helicase PcrA